jgi:hypothetical protein
VPAKVEGTWQTAQGVLTLSQQFQVITGTLGGKPISSGRLRGSEITFTMGGAQYTGQVKGSSMQGTIKGGISPSWSATKR